MSTGMTEFKPFAETVSRVLSALNQNSSGVTDPEQWLIEALTGSGSGNTPTVNEYTSLGWPPLFAAVSRISGHIASMPFEIKQRLPGGGFLPHDDQRNDLWENPNGWQIGSVLKELMQMNVLLHGNGRCLIVRDSTGMPIELVPLLAYNTRTILIKGKKFHWLVAPAFWNYSLGVLEGGQVYYLPDADVFHVPGLGGNGAWGYSIIHMFRETIALGLSGQTASLQAFSNMGRPGIILEAPIGKFRDPKKAQEFLEKFDASQAGIDNAGKTAMLREGVTAKILSMNQEDAQFLKQRMHQREEAALMLFLEAFMGGDKGPYKSITERNSQYMVNCLLRWITKWQQEANRKLLTAEERLAGVLRWRFDPSILLEGDPNSHADYTGKLRQQGAISGNEVRQKHNMPRIDDPALDTYSNPNTTPGGESLSDPDEGDEGSDGGSDGGDDDNEKLRNVARNAIGSRIKRLTFAEAGRVSKTRSAGEGESTLEGFQAFYDKFEGDLREAIDELGGGPILASNYVHDSLRQITEIIAVTDSTQLPDVLDGLVKSQAWGERSDQLTDQILEGACDV